MAYEQTNLTGALFPNNKDGNEARPDFRGDCLIGGVKYRISAWKKTSAGGKPYMSLALSVDEQQAAPTSTPASDPNDPFAF